MFEHPEEDPKRFNDDPMHIPERDQSVIDQMAQAPLETA